MKKMHLPLALALVLLATAVWAADSASDQPLPIIPGAAGFGMETSAGSARHLRDTMLQRGWDDALVAHWDFDDGLPQGGEIMGDASFAGRGEGKALQVNAEGSLVLPKAGGYVKPGAGFTVMAWHRLDKPGGFVASNQVKGKGYWRLGHTPGFGGKWMFWLANPAGEKMHTEYKRDSIGEWRHVAAVYDGETGRARFYTHGRLGHNAWNKSLHDLATAPSRQLTIGARMSGMVDDVMFFNRPLSTEEIGALHADQYAKYHGQRRTRVIKVTNLNTEGPGSLREALEAEGPRVVVFEVSGNIDFSPFGRLSIHQPYVTVAGQTAPSPGITLKGCELVIGTHDVLLQHIRVRVGDLLDPTRPLKNKGGWTQFSERDCMKVDGRRIVIDHCSFSWSTDELAQSAASALTVRHNIFAEALHSPKHHKGGHSRGLLVGTYRPGASHGISVIGNLFAHNKTRNPSVLRYAEIVVANNLVYDANVGIKCDDRRKKPQGPPMMFSAQCNVLRRVNSPFVARGMQPGSRQYFGPGNMVSGETFDSVAEVWNRVKMPFKPGVLEVCRADEPPLAVPGLTIRPADEVEDWVLATAGARPVDRDAVDARIVDHVKTGAGKIISSQNDVGGWPELAENRRELEIPEKPNADEDGDGYTNLEEWLHAFAAEVERKK
jgi:hypothetical protein